MATLRRHAGTLALVLLAVAGGVVVYVDRDAVSTQEADRRKSSLFEAWRKDDVTSVALSYDGKTVRLDRKPAADGGTTPWQVELEGQRYAADEQAVDDYLGRLEFAQPARTIDPGSVDRVAFGLTAPKLSVHVEMGRKAYDLLVGGIAPTPPGSSYVEVPGRGVYVVTPQLAAALRVEPSTFRSRSFVPYFSTDLAKIALDGEGGARHLERAPWAGRHGAAYRFDGSTSEGKVRVSARALDRVLLAFGRMQAESFLTDDAADRALVERVTLQLVPKEGETATIDVGGVCPGHDEQIVAIRRAPTRASVCFAKDVLEALTMPTSEFVDRRFVGAQADTVEELTIDEGGRKLDLARKANGWTIRAPIAREVDEAAGKALMAAFLDVEATKLVEVDPNHVGLVPPRATINVASSDTGPDGTRAERIERLEVGSDHDGVTHVRRLEDGAIGVLATDRVAELLPSELTLRSRKILDEPSAHFQSLRIESGGRVQSLRRKSGGFVLEQPSDPAFAADLGLVSDVLDAVGKLEAERWVTDKTTDSFGFASPRLVIDMELGDEGADRSEDRKVRLELGAPTTEGSYARIAGDPAVFIVTKVVESVAGRLLLDRGALTIEPSRVARVTIAGEDGKPRAVVENSGSTWRIAGAKTATSSAEAARLRDALSDLLAEGAVSLGPPKKNQGFDRPRLTLTIESLRDNGRVSAPIRIAVGAGDSYRGMNVAYVRREGINATYAVAQSKLQALFDAL